MSSKDSVLEVTDQSLEPYVGPRPFRREIIDQVRFFGRDAETDEIVSLIASHRLVLVYAQSGAGKTSIFNAQVIPTLEGYSGFEVLPVARVRITMAPSSIISKDFSDNNSDTSSSQIENIFIYSALQTLRRDIDPISLKNLSLFEFLDDYFPNSKDEDGDLRPQVLIFDQLEELFSFPDIEQQKGFFEQIGDSLENNPLLKIVFIIREDYLAQLDPFKSKLPEKLRPSFRLERLRRNEAILAIKGPLTKFLNKDEVKNIQDKIKELVSDLLKTYIEIPGDGSIQIEGEYIEPIYLQIVCRRWWHESSASKGSDNRMEISKDLANVDKALQDFYEHAVHSAAKQTGVHESRIRNWCQHKLMTSSGTRGMIHQEHKSTAGLNNKAISILEKNYLVRAEIRLGAKWYELAHDRMIEPIKNSNKTWRKKEIKKSLVKKVIIPVVVVIIIGALFAYNAYNQSLNTYNLSIYHLETITTNQIALINSLDQAASALYDSGQYQKAITYYDKILDIDPKYPPSLNGKAKALISLGQYNKALTYLSEALEIEPSYEDALANKGIALVNIGHHSEALKSIDAALAIDPNDTYALNAKGNAFDGLGNYKEAITYYDKALAIDPNFVYALSNKGLDLYNLGKPEEAIPYFDKAISADPKYADSWTNKGLALFSLGNYKEAITYYDKALQLNPNDTYALNGKQNALSRISSPQSIDNPPISNNQSVVTSINTPKEITLGVSDQDPKDNLTANITSVPSHGKLSDINQDTGNVTYTPDQGFTGNDKFEFKANDGKLDSKNAGIISITVIPPPNQPPIANAGQDQTVNAADTVTLDGSGSKDPDGNITSWSWKQVSGPSITINGSDTDRPSFTAPSDITADTILKFSLTVKDDKGSESVPAFVTITVKATTSTAAMPTTNNRTNMTTTPVGNMTPPRTTTTTGAGDATEFIDRGSQLFIEGKYLESYLDIINTSLLLHVIGTHSVIPQANL